jgi:hypothetical protein
MARSFPCFLELQDLLMRLNRVLIVPAILVVGVLAGSLISRPQPLAAQTRITLLSLQTQVDALTARVATLEAALAGPINADTLGGLAAASFTKATDPIPATRLTGTVDQAQLPAYASFEGLYVTGPAYFEESVLAYEGVSVGSGGVSGGMTTTALAGTIRYVPSYRSLQYSDGDSWITIPH